jgi:hypothetical protein
MSLGSVPQAMSQAVAAQKAREKEKVSALGASSPALNGAASSSPLTAAVGSQLRLIVANLNKKNYKTSSEEVKHVSNRSYFFVQFTRVDCYSFRSLGNMAKRLILTSSDFFSREWT